MFPILLAILAAVMYASTNHIDKFLILKAVKDANYRSLLVVSTLIAGGAMTLIYAFVCNFNVFFDWQIFGLLFLNSALVAFAYVLYFKALSREDATILAIMFQLIPVFTLILSPLFLPNQEIAPIQLLGGLIATLAAILITYEPSNKRFNKRRLVALGMMTIVSVIYAIWFIVERYVSLRHDFNQTMFWTSATQFIVGIFIYVFFKSYRKAFNKMFKTSGIKVVGLNFMNEMLSSFGGVVSNYAGTMISVSLVSFTTQSVQPFAVMIIGFVITILFPKIGKENISKRETIKRVIAIILCLIGLALIEFGV